MTMITIVIPTYNRAEYIQETIQSCMAQTYPASEIIVVDDGSTDNTEEIVKRLPVKYIKKENGGPSSARNLGIKNATSKYILPIDSDDTIKPEFLEVVMSEMNGSENKVVSTWMRQRISEYYYVEESWPLPVENIYLDNFASTCSMFSKSAWEKVGGYDEQLIGWEDWDFWIRLKESGCEFSIVPMHLFNYRIQPTNFHQRHGNIFEVEEYFKKKHHIYYSGVAQR